MAAGTLVQPGFSHWPLSFTWAFLSMSASLPYTGLCHSVEAIDVGCSKVTSIWLYYPKGKEHFLFSPPASVIIIANIYCACEDKILF